MKFKPESITHRVDREYSRWYSVETHGPNGCQKRKVLITTWKDPSAMRDHYHDTPKWRSKIMVPMNTGMANVFAGRTRRKATKAALHHYENFLKELGEWG